MKTFKHLFPRVWNFDNLVLAARKAQKGKRFKPNAARFNLNLEKELLRLRRELQERAWRPGPYVTFEIQEPKRRMISAAPYPDRVVHHALMNVIEPLFDRRFIFDSYRTTCDARIATGTPRTTGTTMSGFVAPVCPMGRKTPHGRQAWPEDPVVLQGTPERAVRASRLPSCAGPSDQPNRSRSGPGW